MCALDDAITLEVGVQGSALHYRECYCTFEHTVPAKHAINVLYFWSQVTSSEADVMKVGIYSSISSCTSILSLVTDFIANRIITV